MFQLVKSEGTDTFCGLLNVLSFTGILHFLRLWSFCRVHKWAHGESFVGMTLHMRPRRLAITSSLTCYLQSLIYQNTLVAKAIAACWHLPLRPCISTMFYSECSAYLQTLECGSSSETAQITSGSNGKCWYWIVPAPEFDADALLAQQTVQKSPVHRATHTIRLQS